jgi:Protein of unknown function (DUF3592)
LDLGSFQPAEGAALSPKPRRVPRVLVWHLVLSSLFVGTAIFAAFSAIWLLPLLDWRWTEDRRLESAAKSTRGLVTDVKETILLGGRYPYACTRYRFTFEAADGRRVTGTSYRYRPIRRHDWAAGSEVTVEYDPADPHVNRVQGTSTGPVAPSIWTVVVALGSLAGLALAGRKLCGRLRAIRLLRYGEAVATDEILKYYHIVDGSRIQPKDLAVNRPVLFEPSRRRLGLAIKRLPVEVGPDGNWKSRVGWGRVCTSGLLLAFFLADGVLAALLIDWALD